MNIKLLKFLVIFMGFLIILGFFVLGIALYKKFNKLSNKNVKTLITTNKPKNMLYKEHFVVDNQIFISFDNDKKILIIVYDLNDGTNLKEIEILK